MAPTFINAAIREYLNGKSPPFEERFRRVIRGELKSDADLIEVDGKLDASSNFGFCFLGGSIALF